MRSRPSGGCAVNVCTTVVEVGENREEAVDESVDQPIEQERRPLGVQHLLDLFEHAAGLGAVRAGADAEVEARPRDSSFLGSALLSFKLNWQKLREARRREGSYLLRSNVTGGDPAQLWTFYLQLVEVEQAFKELKGDLAIRPIYHQTDERIEAHIFVAFLAYCLQVTLKQRLRSLAPGLTPRSVLDKMAAIQMVDVQLPTTDGRTVILSRYTEPGVDQAILLQRLNMSLPAQPPPRVIADDP